MCKLYYLFTRVLMTMTTTTTTKISTSSIPSVPAAHKLYSKLQYMNSEKIKKGTEVYANYLRMKISDQMKIKTKNKNEIIINISDTIKHGKINGIPVHVFQYGHLCGDWKTRTPLECEHAFSIVQKEMERMGYFLIEESDPSKSLDIRIVLYNGKPPDGHSYFNILGKLWHGNNVMANYFIYLLIGKN